MSFTALFRGSQPERATRSRSALMPVLAGRSRWDGSAEIGLLDHLFILRALILRDIRLRYRDNSIGFAMEFFRIIVIVYAHYWYFYLRRKPIPAHIPLELFVIAGFSVWYATSYAINGAMHGGVWPGGAVSFPGVTRMHLRVAKAAWATTTNLVFCFGSVLLLNLLGDDLRLPNILMTLPIFCMAGISGFGWGLLMDGLGRFWPVLQPVAKISKWAIFITCGIYFSLATAPPLLAEGFWYNPILHLVEWQRYAFDPGYPVRMVSIVYPSAMAAGLLLLGLMVNRCLRNLDDE